MFCHRGLGRAEYVYQVIQDKIFLPICGIHVDKFTGRISDSVTEQVGQLRDPRYLLSHVHICQLPARIWDSSPRQDHSTSWRLPGRQLAARGAHDKSATCEVGSPGLVLGERLTANSPAVVHGDDESAVFVAASG